MWYVGSRTAKNAHLDDGYICSSKTVKPLILAAPNDWQRQILAIGDAEEMRQLETEILTSVDAKKDQRSLNKHNQDMKFVCRGHTTETIEKIKQNHAFAGKKRPEQSQKLKGRIKTSKELQNISLALKGRKFSDEHLQNLKRAKQKGVYKTPAGIFVSSRDAAIANKCTKTSVLNYCHGYFSTTRKKWYPPSEGWSFLKD